MWLSPSPPSTRTPYGADNAHAAPLAVGTEDNVAADAHELYDMVASDNPQNELLLLPGRDHVNALTAGVFRRAALAFSQDSEAAAKV